MNSVLEEPGMRRAAGRALAEVLNAWLNMAVAAVEPGAAVSAEGAGPGWQAVVALCGERITGDVRLHLPEGFVREAWGRLLGEPGTDPGEAGAFRDLAGELANMVAGRVATALGESGRPCQLGTPEVSFSTVRPGFRPDAPEAIRTEWICAGHWLTLDLRCLPGGT